eukprot:m.128768 g.128768  ORF g.128768 m.128768 type:complete len:220 (+) comp16394_c2_seq2:411-1070(+)
MHRVVRLSHTVGLSVSSMARGSAHRGLAFAQLRPSCLLQPVSEASASSSSNSSRYFLQLHPRAPPARSYAVRPVRPGQTRERIRLAVSQGAHEIRDALGAKLRQETDKVKEKVKEEVGEAKAGIRVLLKKYGRSAVVVYVFVSATLFSTVYYVLLAGVDLEKVLQAMGVDTEKYISPTAGQFVMAYGVYKLLLPLKLAITAALTPSVAVHLKRWFPRFF